jgi:pimeloyl-ACP methyl ester carboxylesterase
MHPSQRTLMAAPIALLVALSSAACGTSGSQEVAPQTTPPSPQSSPQPSPGGSAGPSAQPSPEPSQPPAPTPSTVAPPPEQVSAADAVYDGAPPELVAAGQAGDVVYYLPEQFLLLDASAWLVLYRSTSALGNRIAVSGTVIVPNAAWAGSGPRPILAFAHETTGVTDDCAPSRTLVTATYSELSAVSLALAKGWAVALTDYEGLGTPGHHTYSVNLAEARAVLDAVRAAVRTPGVGLDSSAPVAIWGYSQGGGAAAAAAEAAPTYAPEFAWKGVAAGGTNADLDAIGEAGEGTLYYGFVSAASLGLDTAYPELDLEAYLNDAGKAMLASADTKSACMATLLTDYAFKRTSDYCTSNPRQSPAWQRRFEENKLGLVRIEMPAFLYHGTYDDVIPRSVGAGLRDRWCALGATVQWKEYPDLILGHVSTKASGQPDALQWLADRFDDKPAPSNCP